MNVLATRDSRWTTLATAALLAEGIDSRWQSLPDRSELLLDVPTSEVARATTVLSELLGEEIARRRAPRAPFHQAPLLLQPAFVAGIGMAALCLAFFWVTGPSMAHGWWHRAGALMTESVLQGEWWRIVTAGTLHADESHALGNAGFFLVLMWAAAERLGVGVALFAWLVTAVGGFAASLVLSDTMLTVGASGGLFGLLGAAAGHAVRHRLGEGGLLRQGLLRSLGGAVMLLAFTAFSARANIHAHVGGFVFGVMFGLLAPRAKLASGFQLLAGLVSLIAVAGAWTMAM